MVKLKKITNGVYEEQHSGRYIELMSGKWQILSVLGDVYYTSKTLKDCKIWQSRENKILSWNN
jgi:hypothetical protein